MKSIGTWAASLAILALAGATQMAQAANQPPPPAVQKFAAQMEIGAWTIDEPGCFGPFWGCYTSQEEYVDNHEQPKIPFPLGPVVKARFKEIQDALARGESLFDPDSQCYPSGMPSRGRASFKIAFLTDRILFLYGSAEYRTIYMDGRKIPTQDPAEYTYNGYSVGHWEGTTLVVETRNIVGPNTQISPHIPKTDNFWIVERFTPRSADVMDYQIQMKDEDWWTGVYTEKFRWKRKAAMELAPQQPCIVGDGQRWFIDPTTKSFELTGPGGAPLEKAEP